MTTYNSAELDAVFERAESLLRPALEGWRPVVRHGKDLVVELLRLEKTLFVYRIVSELPDVPSAAAARFFCSRSRAKSKDPDFTVSDELVAELAPSDPSDVSDLGHVAVHNHVTSHFGLRTGALRMFASRRLPDGSALAVKAACALEGGVWTTRDFANKLHSLHVYHVAAAGGGSRYTYLFHERRFQGLLLSEYIMTMLVARIQAKIVASARRLAREEAGARPLPPELPRPLFASGSASAPTRYTSTSAPLFPPEDGYSESASRAFPPAFPLLPTNAIYLGLLGVETDPDQHDEPIKHDNVLMTLSPALDPKREAQYPPQPPSTYLVGQQLVGPPTMEVPPALQMPHAAATIAQAARASLELALRLEGMSLSDSEPADPPPVPLDAPSEPRLPPLPPKALARPRESDHPQPLTRRKLVPIAPAPIAPAPAAPAPPAAPTPPTPPTPPAKRKLVPIAPAPAAPAPLVPIPSPQPPALPRIGFPRFLALLPVSVFVPWPPPPPSPFPSGP